MQCHSFTHDHAFEMQSLHWLKACEQQVRSLVSICKLAHARQQLAKELLHTHARPVLQSTR